MNRQNENIDPARKSRIGNIAILRAVVAGYLFYLGFTILRDLLQGKAAPSGAGSLPVWLLWLCAILFMLAALAFGYYTWRQYQKQMAALRSESTEEKPEQEPPAENNQ